MKKIFIFLISLVSFSVIGQTGTQTGEVSPNLNKNPGASYFLREKINNTSTSGSAGILINSNSTKGYIQLDKDGKLIIYSDSNLYLGDGTQLLILNSKIDIATSGAITLPGGATTYIPFQVGTKASTSGSGLKLSGSGDNSSGVQLYFDDGGVSIAGEVVTPLRCRQLITVDQISGTSICASYSQLVTLGTTGSTKALTTGALRAAYIFNQIGALTITGNAEVQGINQATTLAGNTSVEAGSKFVGIDVNIRGAGTITNNGTCAALLVRSSETTKWPVGLQIANTGATVDIKLQNGETIDNATDGTINIGAANFTSTDKISTTDTVATTSLVSLTGINFCTPTMVTGSGDSILIANPAITAVGAGLIITFIAEGSTAITVPKIIINGGTKYTIKKNKSVGVMAANDIRSGMFCMFGFDGTNWLMMSQLGN